MITGAHTIIYSKDADADRAFFRDVLGFRSVDAGHGWLIFALPPAEAAFHPTDVDEMHELYLMCDDLKAEMAALGKKASNAQMYRKPDGGRLRRSNFPGAASWDSISRSTRPRWLCEVQRSLRQNPN
jgi:catechol 2,3-dioxygenase-like lactoylglutathione lyase family enzyme